MTDNHPPTTNPPTRAGRRVALAIGAALIALGLLLIVALVAANLAESSTRAAIAAERAEAKAKQQQATEGEIRDAHRAAERNKLRRDTFEFLEQQAGNRPLPVACYEGTLWACDIVDVLPTKGMNVRIKVDRPVEGSPELDQRQADELAKVLDVDESPAGRISGVTVEHPVVYVEGLPAA